MLGIGIDTGGTYTDAVVYDMDNKKILCSGKSPTTKAQLEIGISGALDQLDPQLVAKAEMISLSTTLATNACLEDKGSRARLLMIGMNPECMANVDDVYASYGFQDLDQLCFVEGRPENMFSDPKEPDWEQIASLAVNDWKDCAAVGVCQIYPQADGGKLEIKTRKVLRKSRADLSITTAYDMFDEVDPLKRGAGTLLNARLVPLIKEFLIAVKNVMQERKINARVAIVRSDGSLMTEQMAREYPVETLLCGPAASVVGGSVLTGEADAIIVDMGGTTTDVALIRGSKPVTAKNGIAIGKWRTTVQGLYIDTFLLGGDSAVRYNEHGLYLDGRRVIPLSMLQKEHPGIVDKLKKLADSKCTHSRMLHEFYVLQKDISGVGGYTDFEYAVCDMLKKCGPMTIRELPEALGTEIYYMNTERLEAEGVLMRSGLTPTDMMVIKGDFAICDPKAARHALRYLKYNTGISEDQIPDRVYTMVEKKMYCNLVRILLDQKFPKQGRILSQEAVEKLIEWNYEEAVKGEVNEWISQSFRTDLPIVGVGAPIHIFLPRVAELLGTRPLIQDNAPVANALGAIASQIITKVNVKVKAIYEGIDLRGYRVFDEDEMHMFESYEDALALAKKLAEQKVYAKARKQGASENPRIEFSEESALVANSIYETNVIAIATDEYQMG